MSKGAGRTSHTLIFPLLELQIQNFFFWCWFCFLGDCDDFITSCYYRAFPFCKKKQTKYNSGNSVIQKYGHNGSKGFLTLNTPRASGFTAPPSITTELRGASSTLQDKGECKRFHFRNVKMKWIFFLLQGEIKQLTWNRKNTTFSIITVCRHTRAYTYDVVIPRVQETKSQNTATQSYCGLHSHGFSEWRRIGCFHRWQRYQVGNYRQKWRHIPLLRQRVRRTLLLQLFNSDFFPPLFIFFF